MKWETVNFAQMLKLSQEVGVKQEVPHTKRALLEQGLPYSFRRHSISLTEAVELNDGTYLVLVMDEGFTGSDTTGPDAVEVVYYRGYP